VVRVKGEVRETGRWRGCRAEHGDSPGRGRALDRFDRQLTLREVRQAFYKTPGFPLVRSVDEIRVSGPAFASLQVQATDPVALDTDLRRLT
jgi:hypothetical protein